MVGHYKTSILVLQKVFRKYRIVVKEVEIIYAFGQLKQLFLIQAEMKHC